MGVSNRLHRTPRSRLGCKPGVTGAGSVSRTDRLTMLQILALIVLTCVAADISRRVHLNRPVFAQLGQPTSITWLVWLYPLPFFLPLFAKSFFAFTLYRIPLGILFFVPALMSARATRKCFELSGDGRVKPALAAVGMTECSGRLGALLDTFCYAVFAAPDRST